MKYLMIALLSFVLVITIFNAAEAKGKRKSVQPTVVVTAPTPAPEPVAPKPTFMEQQIANALANSTRPVGVTTYGAAAALQSGGIDAAEAASAGW